MRGRSVGKMTFYRGFPYRPFRPKCLSEIGEFRAAGALDWFFRFDGFLSDSVEKIGNEWLEDLLLVGSSKMINGDCLDVDSLPSVDVMRAALACLSSSPISSRSLLATYRIIMGKSAGFRIGQVWVGADNPNDAWYVAPPVEVLSELIRDVCIFCERDDYPIVFRAAVAMNQLLLIHPFLDRNGLMARLLLISILNRKLSSPGFGVGVVRSFWEGHAQGLHASFCAIKERGCWADFVALSENVYLRTFLRCGVGKTDLSANKSM
jgi:hypothetical protein